MMCIRLEVFLSILCIVQILSKLLIDLDHFQCSLYYQYGAPAIDPRSCVYPGDVNVSKWNWEWFIFRHTKSDSWLNLMALI